MTTTEILTKAEKLVSDDKTKAEIQSSKYTSIWSNPFTKLAVDEYSDIHEDVRII